MPRGSTSFPQSVPQTLPQSEQQRHRQSFPITRLVNTLSDLMFPRKRSSHSSLVPEKRTRVQDSGESESGCLFMRRLSDGWVTGSDRSSELLALTCVSDALESLRRSFPVSSFTENLPAIIWRHLLYALPALGPRTQINRTLVSSLLSFAAVSYRLCSGPAGDCRYHPIL